MVGVPLLPLCGSRVGEAKPLAIEAKPLAMETKPLAIEAKP